MLFGIKSVDHVVLLVEKEATSTVEKFRGRAVTELHGGLYRFTLEFSSWNLMSHFYHQYIPGEIWLTTYPVEKVRFGFKQVPAVKLNTPLQSWWLISPHRRGQTTRATMTHVARGHRS